MGEMDDGDKGADASKESNEANESFNISSKKITYFGVYIPIEVQKQDEDIGINVFTKKTEALKLVKKYKKARFKVFEFYEDAVDFATSGCDFPNNNSYLDRLNSENLAAAGEKHSPFRGPTSQNLVKMRKGIEAGDVESVKTTIWENPRYLVGVGDTPSILQEGFRYNALHVAAKAKNPVMCELILNTISNIKFMKKLYFDDTEPEDRAKILLDLYLNTPDKGLHETPLHFAVKFGAAKCVEVLVSFPQCDKNLRNKHGKLPNEIICDRYDGPDASLLSAEIAGYLEDNYYVPVFRTEGNCAPPIIGEPFSPTSPPKFNTDPLSPRMEIHAYAGPMNKEGAEKFRKMWKTPPRVLQFNSPIKSSNVGNVATLRLRDHEKGLERLGDNLAKKMDVAWKEYWPFLDSFIDLASNEGLAQFENYLSEKVAAYYEDSTHSSISRGSVEDLHDKQSFESKERSYKSENSPMWELCKALQACTLNERNCQSPDNNKVLERNGHRSPIATHLAQEVNDLEHYHENTPLSNPYFCIDKSLQVFAKRISNDIIYLLETEYDTCSLIEAQVKQLQLLMSSYICDNRFESVDFTLVHCRLAYLTRQLLVKYMHDTPTNNVLKCMDIWLDATNDYFSSDDEGSHNLQKTASKSQHTICLLKAIRNYLLNNVVFADVTNENECIELWKEMKGCPCTWDLKPLKRNGSKRIYPKHKLTPVLIQFPDEHNNGSKKQLNFSSEDEAEDLYFTPPSSPSLLNFEMDDQEAEGNDIFHETNLPEIEIFIDGDMPTKMDYAAYNALKYAECNINPIEYPNIYKWQHAISLYTEKERFSWTNQSVVKCRLGSPGITSTPVANRVMCSAIAKDNSPEYTPTKSWLRITGVNSPRASLIHQRNNLDATRYSRMKKLYAYKQYTSYNVVKME